jgi:hypothetical protein
MQAVNTVFASLGVRGLTVLFASGDNGVCGGDGSCGNNGQFVPSFPAVSAISVILVLTCVGESLCNRSGRDDALGGV